MLAGQEHGRTIPLADSGNLGGLCSSLAGAIYAVSVRAWTHLSDADTFRASPWPETAGRGEIGQPKLFADIPQWRLDDSAYHCEASWMGFRFLELRVTEPVESASETREGPQMEGTLMLKYVPRTGAWGEADVCQVSFTPALNPGLTVESRKAAKGSVTFHRAAWRAALRLQRREGANHILISRY
jgi:hypothetical protein